MAPPDDGGGDASDNADDNAADNSDDNADNADDNTGDNTGDDNTGEPGDQSDNDDDDSGDGDDADDQSGQNNDDFDEFDFNPEELGYDADATLEDVLKDAQNMKKGTVPEMKRLQGVEERLSKLDAILKANGVSGGVEAALNGTANSNAPGPGQGQQHQLPSVSRTIENYVSRGMIDKDTAKEFQPMMDIVDGIFQERDQMFGFQNQSLIKRIDELEKSLGGVTTSSRKGEYGQLVQKYNKASKGTVRIPPQADLDKLMGKHGIDNYADAFAFQAAKDPKYLSLMVKNVEKQVSGRSRKIRVRKGGMASSRHASQGNYNTSEFINGDGSVNEAKLNAVKDPKAQKRILDEIIKNAGG
jgi:hypothetical protein